FGVMITKWLAIEASVYLPLVLSMIVLGAAFTVVFWVKWIGLVLTMSYKPRLYIEKLAKSMSVSLALLLIGVFAVCICIAPIYKWLIYPQVMAFNVADQVRLIGGGDGGIWLIAQNGAIMGGFGALAVFGIIAVILFMMIINIRSNRLSEVRTPYLCGENIDADIRGLQFTGPGEKPTDII